MKTRKGWVKLYGAKLVENLIQALARVVVSQAMIRLKKLGYRCKNTKHDSLWLLIPKEDGRLEEHKAVILREMNRELPWLPGCPLAAEFKGMATKGLRGDNQGHALCVVCVTSVRISRPDVVELPFVRSRADIHIRANGVQY